MTAKSLIRGHLVVFKNGKWICKDFGIIDVDRPCKTCGKKPGDGGIDPCIDSLIKTLNEAGFDTIASCCGHGYRPANIALRDGREILIARSYEEARKMESVIKVNICGEVTED